jgi:MFS family permease
MQTNATERRLVLVVGAIVFVDTMFYAAITPLLPTLAHQFHLSKLSAGVMTAAYPLGTLLGSLPGGLLAVRAGPKFTVCAGLALLAGSTLAFGFLQNPAALDIARFVEGVGGACSWAGGLAWIVAEAPQERRGGLIGSALGAAIAGALFGPVIGTLANALGRGAVFSAVVVLSIALIVAARRLESHQTRSDQRLGHVATALRNRQVVVGMWLVALPAVVSGILNVLGPLRLHHFGAGVFAIGATYLIADAAEAAISPLIGRISDRRGRWLPLRAGLAVTTGVLVCFTLPDSPAALALLIIATATALAAFWAPAMALLSDAAETSGLEQGFAAALMNLAWAGGQIIGSGGGGALAKSHGDGLPVLIAAGMCAVTLAALARARGQVKLPSWAISTAGRSSSPEQTPASAGRRLED